MFAIDDIQHKVNEYMKCQKDPIYFIETYVKNFQYDNEPIKLREKQKEIIRSLLYDHNVIINGSRQTGKTTVIELYIVWLVTFFKNYTVFVMSKKGDSTVELLRDIQGFFETVPEWLKPKTIKDNAFTKEFSNGSRIKGVTVPKGKEDEAGRGMRGGFIFLDEVAFFDADISKVYTALIPTTTYVFRKYEEKGYPYGIVMVSTPNGTLGRGEFFFKTWTKALNGEIDFKPIRYHWSDVPEYRNDPTWIEKQRKKFPDEREFNQEYELVFLGAKNAFFPDSVIEKLQKFTYDPLKKIALHAGTLDLYDHIDSEKTYLIGIDTATGYASDYSAIIITDFETGLPIAEYREKVVLEDFKQDILTLIEKLNLQNFILIPENNGVGSSISQWLSHTEYASYVFKTKKKASKTSMKVVPGLSTDSKTRPLMLEALYEVVSQNAELIKPNKLKNELIALEKRGSRIEAPPGLHDDTVFAYAFTLYVRQYESTQIKSQTNNRDLIAKQLVAQKVLHDLYSAKRVLPNQMRIDDVSFNSFM